MAEHISAKSARQSGQDTATIMIIDLIKASPLEQTHLQAKDYRNIPGPTRCQPGLLASYGTRQERLLIVGTLTKPYRFATVEVAAGLDEAEWPGSSLDH
jgi:hypothetical protein